jgi:O-antigen ligase
MAIYASLMCLALGLFTSITFLALTHIFIVIPCLYFVPRTNFKGWSKSSWFLLAMIIAIILSIIVNQDIMELGYRPITKVKYYLIALLSIAPYTFWYKDLTDNSEENKQKKIKYLLIAFFLTTTLASLSGMMGLFMGFNPLKGLWRVVARNGGLAGMLMNYAHNMAFFQIILSGMLVCQNELKKYISKNIIYLVFIINLIGIYTTYTRGAWLAFLVAVPFLFIKNHKKIFVITAILLVILGVGVYKFAGKSVIRPDSDIERVSQWKAAIAGFKERPVFGLGYLNFERMSVPLKKKYNIEAVYFGGHAHSNYFEMLASTGLVGFIFFMLWQILWFIEMLRRDDMIGRIGVAFIVVFVVGGLTQATFTLGANLFFIMPIYALTQIDFKILKSSS